MVTNNGENFIGFGFDAEDPRSIRTRKNYELILLSLATGERLDSLAWTSEKPAKSLAASPDRSRIAIASATRVWIVSYQNGFSVFDVLERPKSYLIQVCFYPDGQRLLLANEGYTMATVDLAALNQWNATDVATTDVRCEVSNQFNAIRDWPTSIALSSNQKWVGRSTAYDNIIELFDLETLKLTRFFAGHQNSVRSLQIWQDRIVVSGSSDGTIKIWDIESGDLIDSVLMDEALI